jgi:plastocyanin
MFSLAVLSLVASALASPQYGAPPPSAPSPSSSSSAVASVPSAPPSTSGQVNIDVAPGGGTNFVFSPNNVTASNGTVVTFFFQPGTQHSVTQSSFAEPCTFLAAANGSSGGFDSGLVDAVQFSITITDDTQPIWFHCKQVTHCGLGMVGSINAPTTGNNTFSAFMSAALAIGGNEKTETDNGFVAGGVNAVASVAPAATASPSAAGSSGTTTNNSPSGAVRVGVSAAFISAVSAAVFMLMA